MYISKKKTYKILAYAMSAIFIGSFNGVASAEGERTVDESNYNGGNIISEVRDSDASNNTLNVSNVTTDSEQIDAAWSYSGNTNNNTLNIRNVYATANKNYFHGGYAHENGSASGNIINFYSGTAWEIHGAHTIYGDATRGCW